MKTKILLTILIAGLLNCCNKQQIIDQSGQSSHQTYSNYLDSTCEWNFYGISHWVDAPCDQHSSIKAYSYGDTVMDGKWYHKMYSFNIDSTICSYGTTGESYTKFEFGIREDSSKKIYYYFPGKGEFLLWDFNIKLGDTTEEYCPVVKIDTVWLSAKPLKRFYLGDLKHNDFILEGIGKTTGFFSDFHCGISAPMVLVCYKRQNDVMVFDHEYANWCSQK